MLRLSKYILQILFGWFLFPIFVQAQFFSMMGKVSCEDGKSCFQQNMNELRQTMCIKMQNEMQQSGKGVGYVASEIPRIQTQKNEESDFVVLNIHGLYGDAEQFSKISQQLNAQGVATINVVLPGHGWDRQKANQTKYQQWRDEVQAALKFASKVGKKVIVMGQSTGGLLAYELGQKYPDLIDSVIFVEPAFQVRPLIALSACTVGQLVGSAQQLDFLASIVGLGYLTKQDHSVRMGCQVVELGNEVAASFNTKAEGSICGMGCDGPSENAPKIQDTFSRWKIPSLMVYNPQDQIVDPSLAVRLAKDKANLFQVQKIPAGYPHGSYLPEEFILKFIHERTGRLSEDAWVDLNSLIPRLRIIPKFKGEGSPDAMWYLVNLTPDNFDVSSRKKSLPSEDVLSGYAREKYQQACKFADFKCDGMLKSYIEISQDIYLKIRGATNEQEALAALHQIHDSAKYKEYTETVSAFETKLQNQILSKKLPYFDPLDSLFCKMESPNIMMATGK